MIVTNQLAEIWEVCTSAPLQHTITHNNLLCVHLWRSIILPHLLDDSVDHYQVLCLCCQGYTELRHKDYVVRFMEKSWFGLNSKTNRRLLFKTPLFYCGNTLTIKVIPVSNLLTHSDVSRPCEGLWTSGWATLQSDGSQWTDST